MIKPKHREARARYVNRGNRWYSWHLADSMGCTLTHPTLMTSGLIRTKVAAMQEAKAAALAYNLQFVPHVEQPRAKVPPTCVRSEWRDTG